jgi:hydroxypyruvate reductase
MITLESFNTRTLSNYPAVRRILAAAIQSVEPGNAVGKFLKREGNQLIIDGKNYALEEVRRIHILSLGKASHAMASALSGPLTGLPFNGLIIAKHITAAAPPGFDQILGGHPVPNEDSQAAGHKVLTLLDAVEKDDLLLCLISGGGSALMTAPLPGITLDDMGSLTTALLRSGARVDEINTLRRHLDRLKGGRIAQKVYPARVASLILSDVVGNPLEAIASGPTAPDPSSRDEALNVIRNYGLENQIPRSILDVLRVSYEIPKPGDEIFNRVQNVLVGSNAQAAQAALEAAQAEGFHAQILQTDLQGEARQVAKVICNQLKDAIKTIPPPICLIAGGETTVTVRGSGLGGRNQELALASVIELADIENVMLIALATDGEDGPTDAAGAVITGETYNQGAALGLSPQQFLQENNAYHYFEAIDDLLVPGPTGTNVNDLIFCFGY